MSRTQMSFSNYGKPPEDDQVVLEKADSGA